MKEKTLTTENYALEKMNVAVFVIFTFITGGIYAAVWFLKRLPAINSMNSSFKLGSGVFSFIIAACIVNIALILSVIVGVFGSGLKENMLMSADILSLIAQILILAQSLKTRRVFIDHFEGRISFSWLATVFFGIFYLQYKINRLT